MKFIVFVILFLISSTAFTQDGSKLSLEDLGVSKEDTLQDIESQELLDRRSSYLQKHQTWGLVTLGLMAATFLVAEEAEHEEEDGEDGESGSNIHQYLGLATAAAYWTTFYYQYNAPKPTHMSNEGWNIKLHKSLAWIHVPLMILTPISGIMAWQANKEGREKTGLAAQKGTLGNLAMASFGLAATLMVIEF